VLVLGPALLVGGIVAGLVCGEHLGPGPASVPLAGGLALALVALVMRARRRRGALALGLVGASLLGTAVMQRALDGLVHSPLTAPMVARADCSLRGQLIDDPEATRFSATVLVRAESIRIDHRWRDAGGRTVVVRAAGDAASRVGVLEAGDHVTLRGWLRPLEGFETRLRWRHAVGQFDAHVLVGFTSAPSRLARIANAARGLVLRGADLLPPGDRALLAGFLVGDTRGLDDDVLAQFRLAGLSHMLVVSGANVAFVLALTAPLLRWFELRQRVLGSLLVLVIFGAMTRWEPSVLRACAMASCTLLSVQLGRPAAGPRVLALAVGGLLLVDPFLLHSVGFQLSCAACAGIAVLTPRLVARLRGPGWVRETLATTIGAQVGVAPVAIATFGGLPLVALPANVLAAPLVGPITVLGFAASTIGGALAGSLPDAARLLQLPTRLLLHAMVALAAAASQVPVVVDARALAILAPAIAVGVVLALVRAHRRRVVARTAQSHPTPILRRDVDLPAR